MLLIAGGIGIGLVIGWVAARLLHRAPWNVRTWMLLSLLAIGLIILELASLAAAIGYAAALLVSTLACSTWVRSLEARYGRMN